MKNKYIYVRWIQGEYVVYKIMNDEKKEVIGHTDSIEHAVLIKKALNNLEDKPQVK